MYARIQGGVQFVLVPLVFYLRGFWHRQCVQWPRVVLRASCGLPIMCAFPFPVCLISIALPSRGMLLPRSSLLLLLYTYKHLWVV